MWNGSESSLQLMSLWLFHQYDHHSIQRKEFDLFWVSILCLSAWAVLSKCIRRGRKANELQGRYMVCLHPWQFQPALWLSCGRTLRYSADLYTFCRWLAFCSSSFSEEWYWWGTRATTAVVHSSSHIRKILCIAKMWGHQESLDFHYNMLWNLTGI